MIRLIIFVFSFLYLSSCSFGAALSGSAIENSDFTLKSPYSKVEIGDQIQIYKTTQDTIAGYVIEIIAKDSLIVIEEMSSKEIKSISFNQIERLKQKQTGATKRHLMYGLLIDLCIIIYTYYSTK